MARLLENDNRTVFGRTITAIREECGLRRANLSGLDANLVKRVMKYAMPPVEEIWRIDIAHELLLIRDDQIYIDGFSEKEVGQLLDNITTT